MSRQLLGYELVVSRGARAGLRKKYGSDQAPAARRFANKLDLEYGAICATVSPIYSNDEVVESLVQLINILVEKRVREADVSDGSKVPHGSSKHVKDLESRIKSLTTWKDKEKRGSERRANYTRLIQRLKGELSSARTAAAKKKAKKK